MIAILENIRSLHNVGAVFRTADALGIEKIYLTGSTGHPHPDASWRSDHQQLHKTALGAEEIVPWEYFENINDVITLLKKSDYQIISLELNTNSKNIVGFKPKEKFALIIGNEVEGVSQETLDGSNEIIYIPMLGKKESLNASVSFGIAAFWLTNQ